MQPNIRDLIARLKQAGFEARPGKGSHTVYRKRGISLILPTNHPGKCASDGLAGNVERAIRRTQ